MLGRLILELMTLGQMMLGRLMLGRMMLLLQRLQQKTLVN
jgi:hypothetical protein